MDIERETENYVFYRDNNGIPCYRYKKQQEYDTLMAHIKGTALYRYVSDNRQIQSWQLNGHVICETELYDLFPNMPNVNYELLRTWWGLYRPIAEEIYEEEFSFGEDEPNDRELLTCFILGCCVTI